LRVSFSLNPDSIVLIVATLLRAFVVAQLLPRTNGETDLIYVDVGSLYFYIFLSGNAQRMQADRFDLVDLPNLMALPNIRPATMM
jgi:hypothetical protein